MEPPDTAYLDIRLSTAPGTLWQKVYLVGAVTPLGRPEVGQPGVNLESTMISRQHGRIVREQTGDEPTYFLENPRGKAGIRLYEKLLQPGERHMLCHGYVFYIPGVLVTATHPYVIITFCMGANRTSCLSIMFSQPPYISIFGRLVDFSPQEYALLEYLYLHKDQLCPYHDMIASIWVDKPRTPEKIQAKLEQLYHDHDLFSIKKEALDILVAKVRKKIRQASGGVTLIETVRGAGLCLRTAYISGSGKDS